MSEIDKLKFSQIADEDTRRLNANPYIPPENVEDKVIERDPNLPDLAHSAFFYFYEDERDKVKAKLPADKLGIAIPKHISKEITERWAAMSLAEKARYEELAANDLTRCEEEMAIYREKRAKSRLEQGDNKKATQE
ncbi:hypothetical protein SUGI_1493150 [Cryptomeria japonica]|uniref:HMG box domain-containing protein n=1 Tax=Cryptomeria japonica TaxID=3369 RepID=A0AAD3NTU8_CRYJA|nr:uncharacterized protein LOC131872741 [Cryptomeria japonica]GLJ59118.1 hypothetical protein SUGI_1493150 [Cryptomeria japonica]